MPASQSARCARRGTSRTLGIDYQGDWVRRILSYVSDFMSWDMGEERHTAQTHTADIPNVHYFPVAETRRAEIDPASVRHDKGPAGRDIG